jgi:hypothetical protein
MSVDDTQKVLASLREAAKKVLTAGRARPARDQHHAAGYDVPDKALRDAYAAAGVDRLVLRPRPDLDAAALERFAAETGACSALGRVRDSYEDRKSRSAALRRRLAAVDVRAGRDRHGDRGLG